MGCCGTAGGGNTGVGTTGGGNAGGGNAGVGTAGGGAAGRSKFTGGTFAVALRAGGRGGCESGICCGYC